MARDVKVDDGESHTRGAEEADDNLVDVEKTRERREDSVVSAIYA